MAELSPISGPFLTTEDHRLDWLASIDRLGNSVPIRPCASTCYRFFASIPVTLLASGDLPGDLKIQLHCHAPQHRQFENGRLRMTGRNTCTVQKRAFTVAGVVSSQRGNGRGRIDCQKAETKRIFQACPCDRICAVTRAATRKSNRSPAHSLATDCLTVRSEQVQRIGLQPEANRISGDKCMAAFDHGRQFVGAAA